MLAKHVNVVSLLEFSLRIFRLKIPAQALLANAF
jgi:hypothetical protein